MSGLTESGLLRAYGRRLGQHATADADLERERVRPGPKPLRNVHQCIRCVLTLIPDSTPRVLCQFCWRTRRMKR